MTWEMFKKAFLDRLFPKEKMEAKVVEFINIFQGGISVLEYSIKFTKLSKYAPSLVSDPKDEMSHFVKGVSDDFKEECHLSMVHENMNISHLMVHAQQVEETRAKRKSRDSKRARSFDSCYLENRLDIQENPRLKKSSLIKFLQNFPRLVMIEFNTISIKREEVLAHQTISQLVEIVERSIMVIASLGWRIALGVVRVPTSLSCPNLKEQDEGNGQARGSNVHPPNMDHFYALLSRVNKIFLPM